MFGNTHLSNKQIKKVLKTAKQPYKGTTVLGHALSKHANEAPSVWGKLSGSMLAWHNKGMGHMREIIRGEGDFRKVTSIGKNGKQVTFIEKRLEDGRGIRLQLDYTFKGFIQ